MKKRWLIMLCLLIGLGGMMIPAAGAAVGGECLNLAGTVSLSPSEVLSGQEFVLEYKLTPGGSLTESVSREPIDIIFLADISNSMNQEMNPRNKQYKRIHALRDASKTLMNAFKTNKVNDRIGIISFGTTAYRLLDLTTNYHRAEQILTTLNADPNGWTNMGDAMREADALFASSSRPSTQKAVIALTDGENTYYRTQTYHPWFGWQEELRYGLAEARKYAWEQSVIVADKGIPIYTIAFGTSSGIDHRLLEQISDYSGGKKYDAVDADKLAEVFSNIVEQITLSGQLSNIRITQPLPASGFELAAGNDPGIQLSGNSLTIEVPPIDYPYDEHAERTIQVKLRYNGVGSLTFGDADLHYLNACGTEEQTTIPNGLTLNIDGWKDVWNNLYTGDASGKVIRYKHSVMANPQWSIAEVNSRVVDVSFIDSPEGNDDSTVVVTYADGSTSTWDLRPTAPNVELKDSDGNPITDDAAWHKGKATVRFGGSVNQLPGLTDYLNEDFKNDGAYIAKYQYRINGGAWQEADADTELTIMETGAVKVEARALTEAISGDPSHLIGGLLTERTVLVDDTPPTVNLSVQFGSDKLNPTFKLEAGDPESGIREVQLTVEDKNGNPQTRTYQPASFEQAVTKSWTLSEFFSSEDARIGWSKMTVTVVNNAGMSTNRFHIDAQEKTEHYELVYDGPRGRLTTDADYSVRAAGEPVLVRVEDVTEVLVPGRPDCPECAPVTVTGMDYKIVTTKADGSVTESDWIKLGSMQFRLTGEGNHGVYLKVADSLGNVHDTQAKGQPLHVKINYQQNRH